MTHVHLPTVPPTLDAGALTELIRRAADSDDPFPYASIEVDGWRVQVMRTFNDYKVRLNDSWTFQISSPAETPGNRWEAARDKKDPPRSQDESEHARSRRRGRRRCRRHGHRPHPPRRGYPMTTCRHNTRTTRCHTCPTVVRPGDPWVVHHIISRGEAVASGEPTSSGHAATGPSNAADAPTGQPNKASSTKPRPSETRARRWPGGGDPAHLEAHGGGAVALSGSRPGRGVRAPRALLLGGHVDGLRPRHRFEPTAGLGRPRRVLG